ncbi:ribose-5-phosphate isomerase A [Enterocloster clostridioformis]|uniref:ribose-5-phosphate isomerase A n=1 Tax=Enterocloster clostridioformis TaxID=1531 RepID=UPI00042482FF
MDAIDPDFYSLKGGGGALFRGKIIACKARRVIWISPPTITSTPSFLSFWI